MSDARSFTMLAPMTDDGVHGGALRLLVVDGVSGPNDSFVLPTGTVTFLLTDVEGSTTGWEAAPSGMAEAIPRHYALLDEAIAAHAGVRPVEQGEGDSVVAAFSRASDAVAAAVSAQHALAEEPWPDGVRLRVRMAIHTGEAQLRDEGNYFGQAVIRCARLRAIGHGGQVLVSEATAALVVDRLPDAGRPARSRYPSAEGPGSARAGVAAHASRSHSRASRRCAHWTRSATTCRSSSHR